MSERNILREWLHRHCFEIKEKCVFKFLFLEYSIVGFEFLSNSNSFTVLKNILNLLKKIYYKTMLVNSLLRLLLSVHFFSFSKC